MNTNELKVNHDSSPQDALILAYFRQYPSEAVSTIETFSIKSILDYLAKLPAPEAGVLFSLLDAELISELLNSMDDDLFVRLFSKLNTHVAARLLSRQSKEQIQSRLSLLPKLIANEIEEFLSFKPDTAGAIMETRFTSFNVSYTVEDVLIKIRKLKDRTINTIFVTDDSGHLLGKIPLHLLAISEPTEPIKKLMQRAPSINAMSTREEVLQILDKEKLLQIPVTDVNNVLLGIIRNDALIDATKQELTQNLQAMFGAGREEEALSKVSFAVKKRLPWLQVNLATAFLAAMVVGLFEDTIAQITILAIFLPVVAGQSGNTGSQALAVTMRGLALREIRISQWFKVARKELMVGFINGVAVALTTGIIVYFWASSFGIALVIAISMIISMMIAGFAGAIIPVGLKAIGQDPATSSSIILTTVTDICGFLSFLGLATALASVLGIL